MFRQKPEQVELRCRQVDYFVAKMSAACCLADAEIAEGKFLAVSAFTVFFRGCDAGRAP